VFNCDHSTSLNIHRITIWPKMMSCYIYILKNCCQFLVENYQPVFYEKSFNFKHFFVIWRHNRTNVLKSFVIEKVDELSIGQDNHIGFFIVVDVHKAGFGLKRRQYLLFLQVISNHSAFGCTDRKTFFWGWEDKISSSHERLNSSVNLSRIDNSKDEVKKTSKEYHT